MSKILKWEKGVWGWGYGGYWLVLDGSDGKGRYDVVVRWGICLLIGLFFLGVRRRIMKVMGWSKYDKYNGLDLKELGRSKDVEDVCVVES